MQIGLIGAGSMATGLARGWGEPVLVSDALPERAQALAEETGGEAVGSNAELAERAELVVLCHKPPQLAEVAGQVDGRARAIASIVAATPTGDIEAAYPDTPVYRFLPNIPVEIRQGVICYSPGTRAAEGPEEAVLELFGRLGLVMPLDEPLIEPAMALMSSGPAFMALVAESFARAGARHGLEPRDAARMTIETMAGTAAFLGVHDDDAASLQARVATPGGVTERGLRTLEEERLPEAIGAAVDTVVEATRR